MPFLTTSFRQFIIKSSTCCCLFESTPSRPAANTSSLWSASRPVNGDKDLPRSVFSKTLRNGEAELSSNILAIKYDSNSSTGS